MSGDNYGDMACPSEPSDESFQIQIVGNRTSLRRSSTKIFMSGALYGILCLLIIDQPWMVSARPTLRGDEPRSVSIGSYGRNLAKNAKDIIIHAKPSLNEWTNHSGLNISEGTEEKQFDLKGEAIGEDL